jgi:hypothetical protein
VVEACPFVGIHHPEGDLGGGAPQRDAKWLSPMIEHADGSRRRGGPFRHITSIDPWMTGCYAAISFRCNAGEIDARFRGPRHAGKVGGIDR